jgi:hypothetical protein
MCLRKETYIIRFYNKVAQTNAESINDVPKEVIIFLSNMDYHELIIPFVVERFKNGTYGSLGGLRNHFKTTKNSLLRRLGARSGVWKSQHKTQIS